RAQARPCAFGKLFTRTSCVMGCADSAANPPSWRILGLSAPRAFLGAPPHRRCVEPLGHNARMSKAFTKETDADDAEDDDVGLPPLPPGGKNYITPQGYQRLRDELLSLIDDERPK